MYGARFMFALTQALGLSTSHSRYIKQNGLKGDNALAFKSLALKALDARQGELNLARVTLAKIDKA